MSADELEVPKETEDTPSGPSPANSDAVRKHRERFQDQTDEKREQQQESMSTADKILKARQQKTVTLDLEGIEIEFAVLLGETRDEIDDIQTQVAELADKADGAEDDEELQDAIGMTEDEALAEVQSYRDRFVDILVEHSTDDSLTRDFWLEAYGRDGAGRFAMRLKEASEKADMTEDELRQFRRNRRDER